MKQKYFYKEPTNKFGTSYGYAQVLNTGNPIVVQYHASHNEIENQICAGSAMVYVSADDAVKAAEMEVASIQRLVNYALTCGGVK